MAIEAEGKNAPFFALLKGEGVLLSNVEKYAPSSLNIIDQLFRRGEAMGQLMMFTPSDMIIYHTPKGSERFTTH